MSSLYLTLPDLDLDAQPITLSVWLVKEGSRVIEGEPVVEVSAGVVTVDLPSPATGILRTKLVAEGDTITIGDRLAQIDALVG